MNQLNAEVRVGKEDSDHVGGEIFDTVRFGIDLPSESLDFETNDSESKTYLDVAMFKRQSFQRCVFA